MRRNALAILSKSTSRSSPAAGAGGFSTRRSTTAHACACCGYRRQNHHSSLASLRELTAALPFPIRKIQVDNGTEFPLAFALSCQDLGMRVRYIRPRRPQQNGKVERSHRVDEEEFWERYDGEDFDAAAAALAAWEHRYNHERFSMALRGRTPMEKLAAVLAPTFVMARAPDRVQ